MEYAQLDYGIYVYSKASPSLDGQEDTSRAVR